MVGAQRERVSYLWECQSEMSSWKGDPELSPEHDLGRGFLKAEVEQEVGQMHKQWAEVRVGPAARSVSQQWGWKGRLRSEQGSQATRPGLNSTGSGPPIMVSKQKNKIRCLFHPSYCSWDVGCIGGKRDSRQRPLQWRAHQKNPRRNKHQSSAIGWLEWEAEAVRERCYRETWRVESHNLTRGCICIDWASWEINQT